MSFIKNCFVFLSKKIDFPIEILDRIASIDIEKAQEGTVIEIRENYQYGTSLSLKDDSYNQLLDLAKNVISKSKEILEIAENS